MRERRAGQVVRLAAALALMVVGAAGCTSGPSGEPSAAAPSSAASGAPSPSASSAAAPLTIAITIANKQVSPSGQKIDASVGQTVVLNVTSDMDDEIHAHTGGDGYELEVKAGTPATGTFTLTSPGSFEVESHHLEKTIVIINAR